MKESIDAYKKITFKKKVFECAKNLVGRDHFFQVNQDEESGASKDGQLQ